MRSRNEKLNVEVLTKWVRQPELVVGAVTRVMTDDELLAAMDQAALEAAIDDVFGHRLSAGQKAAFRDELMFAAEARAYSRT